MKSPLETKFQIAILAENHDRMDGLRDAASIEWLICRQTGDYEFHFYRGDVIVSSVNLKTGCFDLQHLLGIIVVGSTDAFEVIKSRWNAGLPTIGVAFRQVPEWESKAILCAAIECLTDDLTSQRRHSGSASLELATYRREFDRLQRCFVRLEEYIGRHSFARTTEIFGYPPNPEAVAKSNGREHFEGIRIPFGRSVTQYLPVDSLGFSSFSIYVSTKPEKAGGPLSVKLRAIETGGILGTWLIDTADVDTGWVELALDHAIDTPALSLAVAVECSMESAGWALALGPPHPYKEFCVCIEGAENFRAPIALRIFSHLPGVRVPASTGAIRPVNSPHVRAEFVPIEGYETVVQVSPPPRDDKPTLVLYDREIGCLTVHPRTGGPTVARLTVDVPSHAWGLSAQICLAHTQANPTEFGLMVSAPSDEKRSLSRLNQLDAPTPSFSGWQTLSPLETRIVSVAFAASPEGEVSILLLTRQAPDSSPDFAWARFSKLEFQILPLSMIGDGEPGLSNAVAVSLAQGAEESSIESTGK